MKKQRMFYLNVVGYKGTRIPSRWSKKSQGLYECRKSTLWKNHVKIDDWEITKYLNKGFSRVKALISY